MDQSQKPLEKSLKTEVEPGFVHIEKLGYFPNQSITSSNDRFLYGSYIDLWRKGDMPQEF